jgi:hypothetical protein
VVIIKKWLYSLLVNFIVIIKNNCIPVTSGQGKTLKAYLTGLLLLSRAIPTDITQRTAPPSAYKGLSFYVITPLT